MPATSSTEPASPAAAPRRSLGPASLCAVCHGWGGQRICAACIGRHAGAVPRCRRCALEVAPGIGVCGACLTHPPAWRSALAALTYAYPWDRLVADFKFRAALELAPVFADLLARAHRTGGTAAPALLLPVPLSAGRLRERGYNQAWEIARRVARRVRCATDPRLLLRVRETPHQLDLPPDRRAANVKGAFAVEPRRLADLRGRDVTLVDDVMTTGATAGEIVRVLLGAGAAAVDVWVVARTPPPDGAG